MGTKNKKIVKPNRFDGNLKEFTSKKRVILFTTLWFIGTSLLVLVMTDLFEESILQKRNILFIGMILLNTMFISRLWRMYLNKNKE